MHRHSIHTLAAILTRFFPLHKTRLETMAVIIIGQAGSCTCRDTCGVSTRACCTFRQDAAVIAWAQACARQVQGRKAIPREKHRYPATSWFRLGLQALGTWLLTNQRQPWKAWNTIHQLSPGKPPKTGKAT